jgi:Protein of unknown function (DUF3592)
MVDLNPVEGLDEDGASHLRSGLFILVIAGLVLIAANFYLSGIGTAEGHVTAVLPTEVIIDGKPAKVFAPQIEFRLPDGQSVTFLDNENAAAQPQYVLHGTVSVIYDPDDPASARIGDRNWVWVNVAILMSAAALWFFRGVLNLAFEVD